MERTVNETRWGNSRHALHRRNATPSYCMEGTPLKDGAPELLPYLGQWVDCETKSGLKKVKVRNWTMMVEGVRHISAQAWNPATLGIVPISALKLPKPVTALAIRPPMAIVVY